MICAHLEKNQEQRDWWVHIFGNFDHKKLFGKSKERKQIKNWTGQEHQKPNDKVAKPTSKQSKSTSIGQMHRTGTRASNSGFRTLEETTRASADERGLVSQTLRDPRIKTRINRSQNACQDSRSRFGHSQSSSKFSDANSGKSRYNTKLGRNTQNQIIRKSKKAQDLMSIYYPLRRIQKAKKKDPPGDTKAKLMEAQLTVATNEKTKPKSTGNQFTDAEKKACTEQGQMIENATAKKKIEKKSVNQTAPKRSPMRKRFKYKFKKQAPKEKSATDNAPVEPGNALASSTMKNMKSRVIKVKSQQKKFSRTVSHSGLRAKRMPKEAFAGSKNLGGKSKYAHRQAKSKNSIKNGSQSKRDEKGAKRRPIWQSQLKANKGKLTSQKSNSKYSERRFNLNQFKGTMIKKNKLLENKRQGGRVKTSMSRFGSQAKSHAKDSKTRAKNGRIQIKENPKNRAKLSLNKVGKKFMTETSEKFRKKSNLLQSDSRSKLNKYADLVKMKSKDAFRHKYHKASKSLVTGSDPKRPEFKKMTRENRLKKQIFRLAKTKTRSNQPVKSHFGKYRPGGVDRPGKRHWTPSKTIQHRIVSQPKTAKQVMSSTAPISKLKYFRNTLKKSKFQQTSNLEDYKQRKQLFARVMSSTERFSQGTRSRASAGPGQTLSSALGRSNFRVNTCWFE